MNAYLNVSSKLFYSFLFVLIGVLMVGTSSGTSSGTSLAKPATLSDIKADEIVVFFNTSAWFDVEQAQWHIPIHGWIYEPEDSTVRRQMVAKSLEAALGLRVTDATEQNYKERVNLLLADSERGKTLVIKFSDRRYVIKASSANGHFKRDLIVDKAIIDRSIVDNAHNDNTAHQGQLTFHTVMPEGDSRAFKGVVNLVAPKGISVISDIDDTIKISQVTDHKALLNNTFFEDFKAVKGMAELYQEWLAKNGALHYVSSSPWQLYPVLLSFLNDSGFPDASFALKDFRFKDSSILNLFKKSSETKPPQIERILNAYPHRQFILVGDSGELDPEIYAKIQQKYPKQIIQIIIRNVTGESLSNQRFNKLLTETPADLWQLFDETSMISKNFIKFTE